jgi:hypothetical protein
LATTPHWLWLPESPAVRFRAAASTHGCICGTGSATGRCGGLPRPR